MYDHVPPYPGDPILSLNQDFMADPRADKVNLSIGVYTDEAGRLPVLDCVQAAADRLRSAARPAAYLPMEGDAGYRHATQRLVFGPGSESVETGRVATVQTVGGSGALRLVADFIHAFLPNSAVWISDPSWDNHEVVMRAAGLQVHRYPYFDAETRGLAFDRMLDTWRSLPAGSVVLMQPCCHNPTGVDLSAEQWQAAIEVLKAGALVPLVDMAYQGFGVEIDEDASPIRAMVAAGLQPLVTSSFSKNFSLYGERCGALSVVCQNRAQAERVLGQLQSGARKQYSSPPRHGAELIAIVLQDHALRQQWHQEVAAMRSRIGRMRHRLAQLVRERLPDTDTAFLTAQRGMFSYTGLGAEQVRMLRERHAVYLVNSGRLCVAGLAESNLARVADALAVVLRGGLH